MPQRGTSLLLVARRYSSKKTKCTPQIDARSCISDSTRPTRPPMRPGSVPVTDASGGLSSSIGAYLSENQPSISAMAMAILTPIRHHAEIFSVPAGSSPSSTRSSHLPPAATRHHQANATKLTNRKRLTCATLGWKLSEVLLKPNLSCS